MSPWNSALRWLDASLSLPTSFFRWPRLFASHFTSPAWIGSASSLGRTLDGARRLRLPDVDDVVWSVVSAVESVALVSFLCFFFVFCGCTI